MTALIPYNSLSHYLKENYGQALYKIALDGGFTCPNRDGTLSEMGCIFCSDKGSGDFAQDKNLSITEQIDKGILSIRAKHPQMDFKKPSFIAYFQAFTNTYDALERLSSLYREALEHPEIAIVSLATRPDCLSQPIIDLIASLNHIKPFWVELGLQTSNEESATYIQRGYTYPVFEDAVLRLHQHHIKTLCHLIIGLPHEDLDDLTTTIQAVNQLPVWGVKLQLLHVLKDTPLAIDYLNHQFEVLDFETYIQWLVTCIGYLRPDIIIHRLTGDGPKELLLAPLWSLNKRKTLNRIHQHLKETKITQGSLL